MTLISHLSLNEIAKMYRLIKVFSILLVTITSLSTINAQLQDTIGLEQKSTIEFKFPLLQTVLDSVIKRSSMVNFRNNNIKAKEAALASERVHWSRNIGFQADSRYGNLNNFSSNEDGEALSQVLTTTKQFNYSVGLFLKFPLFDGLNRKNQIKLAKAEVEAAKNMVQFENDQLRQTVISIYQELQLKHKILEIRAKSLIDGKVNMQMIEKEFRNGVVPISEYVRITNITTNMEVAYQTALSEFITVKKMLEDMAGFVFNFKHTK